MAEIVRVGDLRPTVENGTYAESISSADLVLVRKPTGLDFHEAAALPLAGSAALDLRDTVDFKDGDTLLIVGATGGVGTLAIQLASMRGATVISTARPEDEAFVRDLGAIQTIDHTGSAVDAVRRCTETGSRT